MLSAEGQVGSLQAYQYLMCFCFARDIKFQIASTFLNLIQSMDWYSLVVIFRDSLDNIICLL